MSATTGEPTIAQRVEERPSLELGKVRELGLRELGIRFLAGALTSIVAGAVTLALGARVGGIMLAFPAILAASLTLIAEEEDRGEARECARGAVIGGLAMALFATVAAVSLGKLNGAIALLLATVAWFAGALIGYAVAWFR
jgi:Protein of unknown function (DUF3147)